ncbi:MAG: hypothetical protein IJK04_15880 [Kiritimatiellae bacterium]|nr:hypothetical protein [Kiritimatiellia bacterium]
MPRIIHDRQTRRKSRKRPNREAQRDGRIGFETERDGAVQERRAEVACAGDVAIDAAEGEQLAVNDASWLRELDEQERVRRKGGGEGDFRIRAFRIDDAAGGGLPSAEVEGDRARLRGVVDEKGGGAGDAAFRPRFRPVEWTGFTGPMALPKSIAIVFVMVVSMFLGEVAIVLREQVGAIGVVV